MNKNLQLSLAPRVAGRRRGETTTMEVLVRLEAPDAPADLPARPPLNLALVIDRSGSMAGRPLASAVAAARMMVEALGEKDRVSIVSFDDEVSVDVPSRVAVPHADVVRPLEKIQSGGTTALHQGWLTGAEQVALHTDPEVVSRVLLLTDGMANVGKTDPRQIADDVAQVAASGVTTSTYGLGARFDELLLSQMAEAGQGGCYYGEGPDDLMEPFRAELGLLNALFTRGVRLSLEVPAGVTVTVPNGYRRDADGAWILPDIAYGSQVWALARLEIPSALVDDPSQGGARVLTARATFADRDGAPGVSEPVSLYLPALEAADFEALDEEPEVARRAQEVRAAELQLQVREAALNHDWEEVERIIAAARAEADGNGWIADIAEDLAQFARQRDVARTSKASYYAAMKLSRGHRDKYEMALEAEDGGYTMTRESSKPEFLRRKRSMGRSTERIMQDEPSPPPANKGVRELLAKLIHRKGGDGGKD